MLKEAAVLLKQRGKDVGLITNDQASNLVDTSLLKSSGNVVYEVSGSCFCCNFPGFAEAGLALPAGPVLSFAANESAIHTIIAIFARSRTKVSGPVLFCERSAISSIPPHLYMNIVQDQRRMSYCLCKQGAVSFGICPCLSNLCILNIEERRSCVNNPA
jgi:hypothetical protein